MRGRPYPTQPVPWLGLRRVLWVRVTTGHAGAARAEVAGLTHRRPVVRAVPLSTAATLAAAGVPVVFGASPPRPIPPPRGRPDGRLSLPSRH